jgi:uncharacterized protein YjbI with pentapeptide repeats
MTPKQVNDIFNKLPSKRKKVLVGFLAGHSKAKIMIDADVPSDAALTGHLKELYKNFRIDNIWNDADDRRSGTRKLPLLISLFARCKPELISAQITDVLDNEPISFLEYFSKAIDQLKSKELDVRIGAISNLGTLAKYSQPAEHWTIMEYLASFIRTNAPRREEGEEERSRKLPEDIQAALTVIGGRDIEKDEENKVLNLRNSNLRGADLREAKLQRLDFSGCDLQGTNFRGAYLEWVVLNKAKPTIFGERTDHLEGEIYQEVSFIGANLKNAFFMDAKLKGADFQRANLEKVNLNAANLEKVNFSKANLKGSFLLGAKNLTQLQIKSANGDSKTQLPPYLDIPEHWK